MPKSDFQYVQTPYHCPFCNSDAIEGIKSVDVDGTSATQEITCANCGKSWYDLYKLIGYEEIEHGSR